MDARYTAVPLAAAIPGVHFDVWHGGSVGLSNSNAVYGTIEHVKPRHQVLGETHQDVAALEKFGLHPLGCTSSQLVNQADNYGYPIMGYTTGYTTKLPPPANFEAAIRTPRSSNYPQLVSSSNGIEPTPPAQTSDLVKLLNKEYGSIGGARPEVLQQAVLPS